LICHSIRGGRWIIEALEISADNPLQPSLNESKGYRVSSFFFAKALAANLYRYSTTQSFANSPPPHRPQHTDIMSEAAEVDDKPNWLQSNAEEGYGTQSKYL